MADPTYDTAGNLNTARVTAHKRQPDVMDYAQNSQFRVTFSNFPLAEYFCTTAVIPGISLGVSNVGTRLSNMPIVGDQISYDNFDMTFLVDEKLENYREIYDWMINIGFPDNHAQFRNQERRDQSGMQRLGDRETGGTRFFEKDGGRHVALQRELSGSILSRRDRPSGSFGGGVV